MPDTLTVNLGERSYPIHFGSDLTEAVRSEARGLQFAGRRIAVVTDANVRSAHSAALTAMFGEAPVLEIEPGEESKSLAHFGRILDFLAAQKLDRGGAVFAVGGGVIGDLAGYAAASYLRGVDYFQVPTTLLAMVDSSVGGKTGINLGAGKNLAGAFHQPRGVFISTGLLATLPDREFAAGMAEVIKYSLLGDQELFVRLETDRLDRGDPDIGGVICKCCGAKARIVEADEREMARDGGRALLNLGHTFGHAIEQATGYGAYLHGEAVAIGLAAASRLSHKLGTLPADDVDRIEFVLRAYGLPIKLRSPLARADLIAAMGRDKKARGGSLRFVVLNRIGEAVVRRDIAQALVEAAWRDVGAS